MNHLRILVADDHEMVRKGLRATIEAQRGWEVCGEACTGRETVAKARDLRPDIVVMDFAMPELNGMEATRQIRALLPRTEVLILTMHDSEQLIPALLAAGARGYLLKTDAGECLVAALQALAEHQPFLTPKVSALVLQGYLNPKAQPSPGVDSARARNRPAHCRRQGHQGSRRTAGHQRQNRRDAPHQSHAQARPPLHRRSRPLRHPQSPRSALNRLRKRRTSEYRIHLMSLRPLLAEGRGSDEKSIARN